MAFACSTAPAPPSKTPRATPYLAKRAQCEQIARTATAAVDVKLGVSSGTFAHGPLGKEPPEKIIAFVLADEVKPFGWSADETAAFAKEIWDAGPYSDQTVETLSARLYYQVACRLAAEGTPVRPYPTLTQALESCLSLPDPLGQQSCANAKIR
jgi:hypothetical protein